MIWFHSLINMNMPTTLYSSIRNAHALLPILKAEREFRKIVAFKLFGIDFNQGTR